MKFDVLDIKCPTKKELKETFVAIIFSRGRRLGNHSRAIQTLGGVYAVLDSPIEVSGTYRSLQATPSNRVLSSFANRISSEIFIKHYLSNSATQQS